MGHSERRGKGEADTEVAAKAKYALGKGIRLLHAAESRWRHVRRVLRTTMSFHKLRHMPMFFPRLIGTMLLLPMNPFGQLGRD